MRRVLPLMLLLAPSWAAAQPVGDPTRVRLIQRASVARDRGDLRTALRLAREAAARGTTPSLRLMIAEIARDVGELGAARDEADACVAAVDADPSVANAARIRSECAELSRQLAPQAPPAPAPAPAEQSAASTPVTPPPLTVRIAEPPVERPASRPVAGPLALGAAGLVALGLAGVFFTLRNGAAEERDALCIEGQADCTTANAQAAQAAADHQSRAETYNTLTDVVLPLGAASLAAGALWWLLGGSSAPDRPRAMVLVAPGAAGGFVGLRGSL